MLTIVFIQSVPIMATLKDVAQRAGVSISTVSRVLNRPEKVKPDTRATVEEAIAALNYRPSRVAQRLRDRAGRAELLGMIIPDIQNPFYSEIVRGTEDVSYNRESATILCNSDEDPERQQFYLDVLARESADGVLMPPLFHNGTLALNRDRLPFPVVCFDRRIPGDPVDTVVVNNHQGAYAMTNHLLALGHKRIGLICGPSSLSTSTERAEGYRAALREANQPIDESLIFMDVPRPSAGHKRAHQLLSSDAPPTALFAANNQLALGAFGYAQEHDLRIPDDVAIVGFDDAPWARLLNPPLTTVRQPAYEMGRRSAELLFERIDTPDRMPALITLGPELVIRRSCGATG